MRSLRVCLDLTIGEVDQTGGIWRYAFYLFPEIRDVIAAEHPDMEVYALLSSAASPIPARQVGEPLLSRSTTMSLIQHRWQRRVLAGLRLNAARIDLFHNTEPAAFPISAGRRLVTTVYDQVPLVYPAKSPERRLQRGVMAAKRARQRWRAARADHVIAISETTRRDLVDVVGLDSRRISVVHLGVDHRRFHPNGEAGEASAIRRRYDLPERFFISVGSDHYRKNQRRLFDAWCRIAGAIPEGLVLVGRSIFGRTFNEIVAGAEHRGLGGRFRWLPDVSDEQLPALYRAATATVAPSLYEGFGLTLLEAMACGSPVAAARNGAYEEAGGDAAEYFDPLSEDAIAESLRVISVDCSTRSRLRSAGLRRAELATWRNVAEQTVRVYRNTLGLQ